jgi:rhodanese-related sulfurtransferase
MIFGRDLQRNSYFGLGIFTIFMMLGLSKAYLLPIFVKKSKIVTSRSYIKATILQNTVKSMLSTELNSILKSASRKQYQIIDVREKDELLMAKLKDDDVINLPLSESHKWMNEIVSGKLLDSEKSTICLCHHGVRSFRMANFLGKNMAHRSLWYHFSLSFCSEGSQF